MKNEDVLGNKKNRILLKLEIVKEKVEIVDLLGKLEKGLEDVFVEIRENVLML